LSSTLLAKRFPEFTTFFDKDFSLKPPYYINGIKSATTLLYNSATVPVVVAIIFLLLN